MVHTPSSATPEVWKRQKQLLGQPGSFTWRSRVGTQQQQQQHQQQQQQQQQQARAA
jgi:hypothetical protein